MYIRVLLALLVVAGAGCGIDDEDRCGEGYEFVDETCMEIVESQGGLGDPCNLDEDCTAEEVNFCAKDPTQPDVPGLCTIKDCIVDPDSCPDEYKCCNLPQQYNDFGFPYFCMPQEAYDAQPETCSG